MRKKFPILPAHPERTCWGCDKYCAANAMMCGNGSVRTPHPSELFGEDWVAFGLPAEDESTVESVTPGATLGAASPQEGV